MFISICTLSPKFAENSYYKFGADRPIVNKYTDIIPILAIVDFALGWDVNSHQAQLLRFQCQDN